MRGAPFLFLLATACSMRSMESRDAAREEAPVGLTQENLREVHVHIVIPGGRFAAYQFLIRWDPTVARIRSIHPCRSDRFPANPEFDAATFSTGMTRVVSSSIYGVGRGDYHLFTIAFVPVGSGKTKIEVVTEGLYDDSPMPRKIEGELRGGPWEIDFS